MLRTRIWVLYLPTSHHCESQREAIIYGDHFSSRQILLLCNSLGTFSRLARSHSWAREGRKKNKETSVALRAKSVGTVSQSSLCQLKCSREMEFALLFSWEQGGQGWEPGSFKRTASAPDDLTRNLSTSRSNTRALYSAFRLSSQKPRLQKQILPFSPLPSRLPSQTSAFPKSVTPEILCVFSLTRETPYFPLPAFHFRSGCFNLGIWI